MTLLGDEEIAKVFEDLSKKWDGLDCIVHSVGFAPGDQLDGDFTDATTREGFRIAHDISAYSFVALAKAGRPMMKGRNGSLLTLSYLGAERTMPNYNVMGMAKASLEAGVRYLAGSLGPEGTRVNCVSAGPIRTLAASGIKNFHSSQATIRGSKNYAGVANPVVDSLLNQLLAAKTRDEQVAATRALDRVLLWQHYMIPNWYLNNHRLAYRNRFAMVTTPPYTLGLRAWWLKPLENAQ